ncbi:hypothetical protein Cni_G23894 [Canna indica]|uniref:Uncharacterized protein n=1 Tax=Canna indica TaxID=4628 RepID=A0AAQ3KY19_9LILI|nr:hypothetical protein Cni_G23894 [Canna indica]
MGGDYNMTRFDFERKNCEGSSGDSLRFSRFINSEGLVDLPLMWKQFTWTNNQSSPSLAKLDRGLFLLISQIEALSYGTLVVEEQYIQLHSPIGMVAPSQFLFGCCSLVYPMAISSEVYHTMGDSIFNAELIASIAGLWNLKLNHYTQKLKPQGDDHELLTLRSLKLELDSALEIEDAIWRQRAKTRWIKDGDRCSKFYHQWASQKRRRN